MTKNEVLHIRVNGNIKHSAEQTLNILGVSLSEAINMFLHQINLVGGLPFDVKVPLAANSVIAQSKEELYEMLEVGRKQIQEGKVVDADIVMGQIKDKYGFSS